jgi:adenylate cyclase
MHRFKVLERLLRVQMDARRSKGRTLQTLIALALAGLWGAALGYGHYRGDMWFLERVEATMTDIRMLMRGPRPAPDAVTIVAIDDDVVGREGGYPLSRATLARIIDGIARLKPKVIAVDLLLVDRGPEEGDRALTQALGASPSVIAAAAVFAEDQQFLSAAGDGPLARTPVAERFLLPLKLFTDVAAVGVVNVAADQTGTPRFIPMLFRTGERVEASFPLRAVASAAGQDPEIEPDGLSIGGRTIRTDIGQLLPVAFYGPRGTIRTLGAAAALDGRLPPDAIKDRIVVVGATVTGGGDVFPTSFDPVLPGVEVIATAISHLVTGDQMVRDRHVRLIDAAGAIMLPMLLVGLLGWRRSVVGFAAIAGVVLTWLVLNVTAFVNGTWFSAALPMMAVGPPVMLFGATQLWLGRRRAQYFASQSALLQRFQAAGLGKWLASHPDFLAEPVREDAAVVFIDISGFTGLSETLGPDATRELLYPFHTMIDRAVVEAGGIVTGFMGDGAMILFGLPEPSSNDASNAARCCVSLSEGTKAWLASLPAAVASRIGFKIGAHFGAIVASRLGGQSHQHIAATGDTVNVASRLMEVAAAHGAEVAVSQDMLDIAGRDCAFFTSGSLSGPMETQIRGRAGSLMIWLWRSSTEIADRQQLPEL